MSKKIRVLDYDIIYLSYDEPNAEKNYADLCSKVPWAKRVHGVKGSDAAHKACAELSETDRFITIDGDNIINESFINQEQEFDDEVELDHCVISWAASNQINGLIYGNGGIKCWPKQHVLRMRTHENADPKNLQAQVEFCWDTRYIQVEKCFSTVMNNASSKQAWRAGFREGVKMCLNRGERPTQVNDFFKNDWRNLHRAYIWMSVGSDVDNGLWAIYGARQGFYKTMFTDWDYINVRDFDYLNNLWETEISLDKDDNALLEGVSNLGKKIKNLIDIPIPTMSLESEASRFFKHTYRSPARLGEGFLKNN